LRGTKFIKTFFIAYIHVDEDERHNAQGKSQNVERSKEFASPDFATSDDEEISKHMLRFWCEYFQQLVQTMRIRF
jgi:hypothetical protein